MNVMVSLPDDFAARFGPETDRDRHILEVLALHEYRAGRMSRAALREVLRFQTRGELDGFLREHGVDDGITIEQFDRQMQDLDRIGF